MSRAELVQEPSQAHAAPVEIDPIVEKHRGSRGSLIAILQDVQARYGYLPEDALKTVSRLTGQSLTEIYGVASFYRAFSLKPRGKHVICVCAGTACHVRGAPIVTAEFERQLKVGVGQTTPDNEFSLETVNCVGACALGPIVVADGRYEANVGTAAVKKIIRKTAKGDADVPVEGDDRIFPVDVSCPRCNHRLMDPAHLIDGYPSIRVTIYAGRRHGWLRLSSLYGSYHVQSEFEVEHEAVPDFFCPHCHTELRGAADCVDCGAPMVPMFVRGGGVVQICARRGCKGHMLDLNGVSS